MKYCSQELKYILHPFWRALNFAFEDKSSEATKGRYVLEVTNHLHWTREDEVEEGQSLIGALLQRQTLSSCFPISCPVCRG